MNLTNTTAVPVTAEPAPLEVREAVHRLSRRFPNGTVQTIAPCAGYKRWIVNVRVQDVLVASERVYPDFARQVELALEIDGVTDSVPPRSSWYEAEGEPRIDSQWDEREAG